MTDNGNNNCTAIVTGRYGDDQWTFGQAWFQGKYVDLNWEGLERSVAVLKDKTVGAGAHGAEESSAVRRGSAMALVGVVLRCCVVVGGLLVL